MVLRNVETEGKNTRFWFYDRNRGWKTPLVKGTLIYADKNGIKIRFPHIVLDIEWGVTLQSMEELLHKIER